jgi:hypothetical protein
LRPAGLENKSALKRDPARRDSGERFSLGVIKKRVPLQEYALRRAIAAARFFSGDLLWLVTITGIF